MIFSLVSLLAAEETKKGSSTVELFSNQKTKVTQGHDIFVSADSGQLHFVINPNASKPERVYYRYKLEGYDVNWINPGGYFRIVVDFLDSNKQTISEEDSSITEQSPKWSGSIENAQFIPQRFEAPLPPGTSFIKVSFHNGLITRPVGFYAIDDLVLTLSFANGSQPDLKIPLISDKGFEMNENGGTLEGWERIGNAPRMSQIVPRQGHPPLLTISVDDHYLTSGWSTVVPIPPDSTGKVRLDWSHAASFGSGGALAIYRKGIPPGSYPLLLQSVSFNGTPLNEEHLTTIHVVVPFHKTPLFWEGIGLTVAIIGGLVIRYLTRRKLQRRVQILEQERILIEERARIARDLHDSLGSDLTNIASLTDLAQFEVDSPEKSRENLDQLFELTRKLTRQVDEIVWAVNPENDSLEGFIPFLSNYAMNCLQAAGIQCRLDIPTSLPNVSLNSSQRHNLFLIVKEGLNNIVKHSQTTEAWLRIRFDGNLLEIELQDQGCGIPAEAVPGDGLINIRKRIEKLGGIFTIGGEPGKGTQLLIQLPLPCHS